jgi:hypothetical protein
MHTDSSRTPEIPAPVSEEQLRSFLNTFGLAASLFVALDTARQNKQEPKHERDHEPLPDIILYESQV